MFEYKMHITPDDYLHSLSEKDCRDYLFIQPVGEHKCNEMSDVYYMKDAFVPYHEHSRGYETFTIDSGSVEVTINGKRCVVGKGDMLHIPPYTSHGFRFLEENTIWRELFQDMDMYGGIMEKSLIQRSFPEKLDDPDFMAAYRLRHHTVRLGEPDAVEVPKEQIPQVRPKGSALTRFRFDGVVCNQKVGRWETGGVREIWEFVLDEGVTVEWMEPHANWDLFVVLEGNVAVEAAGETFTANPRDIINIPPYTAHKLTAGKGGATIQANNCRSLALRMFEEIELLGANQPDKLQDFDAVRKIMRSCGCYITGFHK